MHPRNDQTPPTWQPIDDCPALADAPLLEAMARLGRRWSAQAANVDPVTLARLHRRLRRETAVEAGLLAGLYWLDREQIPALVNEPPPRRLAGHDADATRRIVERVAEQNVAIDMLLDITEGPVSLSAHFLRQLNGQLLRQTADGPSTPSPYRTAAWCHPRERGVGPACCPPEQIAAELERLLAMHEAQRGDATPAAIAAAWLCHRCTQICPFADGNGRVARCLAMLVLLQAGWLPLLLRDMPTDRAAWLAGLHAADDGDLVPLTQWILERERDTMQWLLAQCGQRADEPGPLAALTALAADSTAPSAASAASDAEPGAAAPQPDSEPETERPALLQDLADGKLSALSNLPLDTLRGMMDKALRERGDNAPDTHQWRDEMVDTVCYIVDHPGDPASPLFVQSRELGERLSALTQTILHEVQRDLGGESEHIAVDLPERWQGSREQVEALAQQLDYQVRWQPFCAAHTLRVRACGMGTEMHFILHGTSLQSLGLLAGIGYAHCYPLQGETIGDASLLTDSYYPICYLQPMDEARELFSRWIMQCVRCGLRRFQELL